MSYAPNSIIPVSAVAVGDFNGDGKPDLAVAEGTLGNIYVMLGDGDGTFQAPIIYATGLAPTSVTVGDVNGDGHLDLVVAFGSGAGGGVSVLLGNGDGTFQAPINTLVGLQNPSSGLGSSPTSVALQDLNSDGHPDLAITDATSGNAYVLLGNGDGTFQAPVAYAAGPYPISIAVGDFNGDGIPDLAAADDQGGVSVLLGNGDGTFQAAVSYAAGSNPAYVAVGDLNDDGKPDLAVPDYQGGVSVLLGNGDGTFQAPVNYLAGPVPDSVAVADFNGDGKPDLAVANNQGAVSVLLSNGDGTFQAPAISYIAGSVPDSVAVADFNGDGKPDLAVGSYSSQNVLIILNTTGASVPVTLNNGNTPVAALGQSSLSTPMSVPPGGSNTVAFATVWVDEGSGVSGTTFNVTATYGGQRMTSAGPASYDYNYAPISSQVFYLVNPPTGMNTLVVNATASSGTIQEVIANLVSYNGVNLSAPVRPGTYQTLNSANGVPVGSFTATISSNPNDSTLGVVEQTFHFATPASNQTVDSAAAGYFAIGSDHATIGAPSVSDTWTFTDPNAFYAYVGFSIEAANSIPMPTLTYTANAVSRTYGTANPTFTGTVTGFVGSDTQANSTSGTLTFTSPATTSSNPGSYAVNGSGLTSSKYVFVQAGSNTTALTITLPITTTGTQYYLAPAVGGGNDFNDGLSPSTPWLTPNHPVNCGDVITAAASTAYSGANFSVGNWGSVSCSAGNNVAWIQCATFDACKVTSTPEDVGFWIDKSYWGVQGWEVDGSNNGDCFAAEASPVNPVTVHHVVFANDIAVTCGSTGFGSSSLYGSTTASADYIAVVGTASYNTALSPGNCGEAISIFQPILSDSNPGTHFFIAGNFAWDAIDATTCNSNHPEDGEGIILDTFNGSQSGIVPYAGQTVVENNIVLFNGGRGLQIVQNSAGNIYFKQNTVYGNNRDSTQGGFCGEIISNVNSGNTYISGNIAATSASTTCNGSTWWDYIVSISNTNVQISSGIGYSPAGQTCEAINGGAFSCSQTALLTINPNFNNPINPGAPSCSSFASVPACMAGIISDYTPTNASATSYGYQIPSTTVVSDPLFPQWLCNVNLPPGLVTMGCD